MAKKGPAGGRPSGRRGKGGIGPGPAYKPTKTKKGTKHSGQTRPPEKPCKATMAAVPWTIIKLLFGWRPEGYKVANVPWPSAS